MRRRSLLERFVVYCRRPQQLIISLPPYTTSLVTGAVSLRLGLRLYRDNLVLMIPSIVGMLVSFTFFASRSWFPLATVIPSSLVVTFLTLLKEFLVMVGQMGMSGNVISKGRTGLADWVWSVKRYSSRFVGLYLFYWAIGMGINSLAIALSFLFREALTLPVIRILNSFTFILNTSILYMLLAPTAVDDKGLGESIDLGLTTIWRRPRAFLGYIAFAFVIELSTRSLGNIDYGPVTGPFSPAAMVSEVIRAIIWPILFLLPFLIYAERRGV